MDWDLDWDEFQRNALESASLGFLRAPRQKTYTPGSSKLTLRQALAERLAQQNHAQRQNPTFQSEFADAASLGFWPRR
jgi:hypothetical protein